MKMNMIMKIVMKIGMMNMKNNKFISQYFVFYM